MRRYKHTGLLAISFLITITIGCKEKERCIIKIKETRVDTLDNSYLNHYIAFASDTDWFAMEKFGDSVATSNGTKNTTIIGFIYPEHSMPTFNENSFSIRKTGEEPYFIIATYQCCYPTETGLKRKPEAYKKAKEYEKKNSK